MPPPAELTSMNARLTRIQIRALGTYTPTEKGGVGRDKDRYAVGKCFIRTMVSLMGFYLSPAFAESAHGHQTQPQIMNVTEFVKRNKNPSQGLDGDAH